MNFSCELANRLSYSHSIGTTQQVKGTIKTGYNWMNLQEMILSLKR